MEKSGPAKADINRHQLYMSMTPVIIIYMSIISILYSLGLFAKTVVHLFNSWGSKAAKAKETPF